MKNLIFSVVLGAVTLCSTVGFAQTQQVTPPVASDSRNEERCEDRYVTRIVNGHRVYESVCAEIIHAEVQRPYAFSVTSRGPLGYQPEQMPLRFVPQVIHATRRTPF